MTDEMKKAVSSWETGKFIPDAEHLPQLLRYQLTTMTEAFKRLL